MRNASDHLLGVAICVQKGGVSQRNDARAVEQHTSAYVRHKETKPKVKRTRMALWKSPEMASLTARHCSLKRAGMPSTCKRARVYVCVSVCACVCVCLCVYVCVCVCVFGVCVRVSVIVCVCLSA
jgi:Flp pilus assembly protein TadB